MINRRFFFIAILMTCAGVAGPGLFGALADQDPGKSSLSISQGRKEAVKQYLDEFVSPQFQKSYPKIYSALTHAFEKLPENVFLKLTDRNRPIIFVISITSGIGRYANATEFIMREDDPPAFEDGFYLVTLSDELNDTKDPEAIEGVLFHEMAHRYLEHLKAGKLSCEMEREANRLVKAWGFEKEYSKASGVFGSKKKGDSPCQEEKPRQGGINSH